MRINKKIFFVFIIVPFLFNKTIAQNQSSFFKSAKFANALKVGILNGKSDKVGTEIQLISGLTYKTWFTGLGGGIDYYGDYRSIPVFISLQKIFKKKNTPFICTDVGYNFPLIDKNQINQYWVQYKFQGGLYFDAGVGYKFEVRQSVGLTLSVGYSYKNLLKKDTIPNYGPTGQPLPPRTETFDYKLRRLSFKIGVWF